MAQIEVTADGVTLISYWQYNSEQKRTMWTEDNQSIVFEVTTIPEGAVVRRATFTANLGDVKINANKALIYGQDVKAYIGEGNYTTRVSLRSNRQLTVSIAFKVNPAPFADTNLHMMRWFITEPKLTIVYDMEEYTEPPDEPRLVLEPKHTIKLFSPQETTFVGNGLCVLTPVSCTVSETAGGEYELEMEHPIDELGRWELLREDYIIEAPIPPTYIPEITMPPWEIWETNKETDLYTTLPSYTKADNTSAISTMWDATQWNSHTQYESGDYVIYNNAIYKAGAVTILGQNPLSGNGIWAYLGEYDPDKKRPTSGTGGQFNPGVVGETLQEGELVYKVADYNATWMQVRSLRGITGYVRIEDCTKQQSSAEETEPPRILYTQLFRIYQISGEDDTHTITVSARHISYDLQRNVMYDCQLEECEPATAIASIQGSMVNDDETQMRNSNLRFIDGEWVQMQSAERRKIISDLTEPLVTVNWSYQNPIQALLDPEEGLAGKTKAKVIRDNQDIYILDNTSPRRGPTITYGVNLRGVTWTRSIDDVVTRIIPRAKDDKDKYIYLDELYVDSDAIGEYAVVSTEILDSQYKVGQKIKHLDGTETTLSLTDVMERMLSEAEDRYYVDHCDSVTVGLDVEFLLLGDTEEFAQYRNLQRLQIYDLINVNTGSGMRTTAQVSGYEWDCVLGRYNSISIGKVYKQSRRALPGYRLAQGAITYSKLAPDLITYIKGAT